MGTTFSRFFALSCNEKIRFAVYFLCNFYHDMIYSIINLINIIRLRSSGVMVGKGFSWAGTLPEKRRDCCDTDSDGDIHIGKNCWIGMNTVILKGVTIGYNSIIGAGSVVNSDIPADLLAAGVPAKVVKKYPRGELT